MDQEVTVRFQVNGRPTTVSAPAIANAIYDAVGVRIRDLPMTPDRIKKTLSEKTKKEI